MRSLTIADRLSLFYGRHSRFVIIVNMRISSRHRIFGISSLTRDSSLILHYLATASLPLGVCPRGVLLEHFDLSDQWSPLISAMKVRQDYHSCSSELRPSTEGQLSALPDSSRRVEGVACQEGHLPSVAREDGSCLLAKFDTWEVRRATIKGWLGLIAETA